MVKHHCNPLYAAGLFIMGGIVGLLSCTDADMIHHFTSVVVAAGFLYITLAVPNKKVPTKQ